MHICDLIKNQDTYRADVNQTVLEVAQSMVARNIGAVPVLRDGVLAGIFSERDLMKRVVVEGRDPRKTRIGDVMTPDPLTVSPQEKAETCMLLIICPSATGFDCRVLSRFATFSCMISTRRMTKSA